MKLKYVLKTLMNEENLSQVALARLTGIPPQTINNWLSGQEPRHVAQLKIVADYFKVTLDFLLFESTVLKGSKNVFKMRDYKIVVAEVEIYPRL